MQQGPGLLVLKSGVNHLTSQNEHFSFLTASSYSGSTDGVFSGIGKKGNANVQLARILQYLECPQWVVLSDPHLSLSTPCRKYEIN